MMGLGFDINVRQVQNCRSGWKLPAIERIPNTTHNYLKAFELISRPIHTEPKMKISEYNSNIV